MWQGTRPLHWNYKEWFIRNRVLTSIDNCSTNSLCDNSLLNEVAINKNLVKQKIFFSNSLVNEVGIFSGSPVFPLHTCIFARANDLPSRSRLCLPARSLLLDATGESLQFLTPITCTCSWMCLISRNWLVDTYCCSLLLRVGGRQILLMWRTCSYNLQIVSAGTNTANCL